MQEFLMQGWLKDLWMICEYIMQDVLYDESTIYREIADNLQHRGWVLQDLCDLWVCLRKAGSMDDRWVNYQGFIN